MASEKAKRWPVWWRHWVWTWCPLRRTNEVFSDLQPRHGTPAHQAWAQVAAAEAVTCTGDWVRGCDGAMTGSDVDSVSVSVATRRLSALRLTSCSTWFSSRLHLLASVSAYRNRSPAYNEARPWGRARVRPFKISSSPSLVTFFLLL